MNYILSKVRSVARELLTLDPKDPKRLFEGAALLRRLTRLGVLAEGETKLDACLGLTLSQFLERRLQTRVFKAGYAKSIHHARVLIKQRHIRVGRQIVNVPSFTVRLESEKHIDFALQSPFGGARSGAFIFMNFLYTYFRSVLFLHMGKKVQFLKRNLKSVR